MELRVEPGFQGHTPTRFCEPSIFASSTPPLRIVLVPLWGLCGTHFCGVAKGKIECLVVWGILQDKVVNRLCGEYYKIKSCLAKRIREVLLKIFWGLFCRLYKHSIVWSTSVGCQLPCVRNTATLPSPQTSLRQTPLPFVWPRWQYKASLVNIWLEPKCKLLFLIYLLRMPFVIHGHLLTNRIGFELDSPWSSKYWLDYYYA